MDYRDQPAAPYNNQTSGTYMPAAVSDESASRLRDGIGLAEQTLSEIHDAISFLEKRLDTVLTPVPPATNAAGLPSKTGMVASHLAGRVVILNEGFNAAVGRLRHLAQRVEV